MEEKNYLDIAATAEQVKKSIEEVVGVLTNNVLENNNKVFTLEVDTNGISENPTSEELLERVGIVLKTTEINKPLIEGQLNEMIVGDGKGWGAGANWFIENKAISGDSGNNLATNSNIFGWKKEDDKKTSLIFTDGAALNNDNIDDKENSFKNYNFFQLGENSNVLVRNGSDVKIGRTFTSNNSPTRVHIYDGAAIDIDGGLNRGADSNKEDHDYYGSPEVFIHGNVSINIDDGVSSERPYYGENSVIETPGPKLLMHDKSVFNMTGGSYFSVTDTAKVFFDKETQIYMKGGVTSVEGGLFTFNVKEDYEPCICMNGGGTIIFNANEVGNIKYDPLLLASPNSFIFNGQGATGRIGNKPSITNWNFDGQHLLKPENRNPRIQIADETMIIVDAARGSGANYIKIGAGENQLLQLHLTGNIFQQMSGNAHSEIHDDSKLIMRGPLGSNQPWLDGVQYGGHCDRDWRRPILQDNSPVLGMYDVSQFIMRGTWNVDDDWTLNSFEMTLGDWDITLPLPTSVEDLPEEFKQKLFIGNMTKIRDYKDKDGNILTTFTLTGTNLKVANYEYSTKPLDWKEHIDKIENQPVVEIIENADIRIYGNSELKLTNYSIIANSEGFTFKDNTIGEEVSFSISELKELKKLLTGATITE